MNVILANLHNETRRYYSKTVTENITAVMQNITSRKW